MTKKGLFCKEVLQKGRVGKSSCAEDVPIQGIRDNSQQYV